MLCRLCDAGLFELQHRAALRVGLLGPAFSPRLHLRARPFHHWPDTVLGATRSLIGELLNLGVQESIAGWIQLQPTSTVGLRLHGSGTGLPRDILLCHMPELSHTGAPYDIARTSLLIKR